MLSKGEDCDIQFITGIGGTVAREDCCAHIILSWVLSKIFSNFKAQGLTSIPTPPMTEFFYVHDKINVQLLLVS